MKLGRAKEQKFVLSTNDRFTITETQATLGAKTGGLKSASGVG